MITRRKKIVVAVYIGLLLWVNLYICRDLFFTEYTGKTNSLQGLWISMARLAGEHWFRPSWWPYQDGGEPFEHTYMPLVPAATAVYSRMGHVSPSRAFNGIMGIVMCLGPLTMFWMAWRMTGAAGYSFWAALAYSLTSPARALIRDPNFSLAHVWTCRRFYTMIVWDDIPHGTALCFLPLALLFAWRAVEKRRGRDAALAIVFIALAGFASVFGATSMILAAVCLLAALEPRPLGSGVLRMAWLGLVGYLIVCPFLPPSLIGTIRDNQQIFAQEKWTLASFTTLCLVIFGGTVLWRILRRRVADRTVRFFVLLAYVFSAIPLLGVYLERHFLPQPGRYQPEMEIAICLAAVFGLRALIERFPASVKATLALVVLAVAAEQIVDHRVFAKQAVRSVDITQTVEYRIAQWVNANLPRGRVMVHGSIAQWFTVFSNAPQLSGGSYSTAPNLRQLEAMRIILTSVGAEGAAESLLWLKAFGIQAVVVTVPGSGEFWGPFPDPKKFEGMLPVLARWEAVTIYKVPSPTDSIARVVPEGAVARGHSRRDLERYVAALDDPLMPVASMEWDGFRKARIRSVVRRGQTVSVQTAYHPGWHAWANGRRVEVRRDGLGFLNLLPGCDGECVIALEYNGGWEYWLCRLISLMTMIGLALWAVRAWLRKRRGPLAGGSACPTTL